MSRSDLPWLFQWPGEWRPLLCSSQLHRRRANWWQHCRGGGWETFLHLPYIQRKLWRQQIYNFAGARTNKKKQNKKKNPEESCHEGLIPDFLLKCIAAANTCKTNELEKINSVCLRSMSCPLLASNVIWVIWQLAWVFCRAVQAQTARNITKRVTQKELSATPTYVTCCPMLPQEVRLETSPISTKNGWWCSFNIQVHLTS